MMTPEAERNQRQEGGCNSRASSDRAGVPELPCSLVLKESGAFIRSVTPNGSIGRAWAAE